MPGAPGRPVESGRVEESEEPGRPGVPGALRGSVRSRVLAAALRRTLRPLLERTPVTPETLRRARGITGGLAPLLGPVPFGTTVRRIPLPGCHADLVRTGRDTGTRRAVLYAHGGGFVLGSARLWRAQVARLSALTGSPVLAVNYRMVPEHRVDDGVQDCVDAYRWLLDQGRTGEDVVLAGDSAGANLAFAVALRARERGLPRPAGIAATSPWLDLAATGPSYTANRLLDPFLPARAAADVARMCAVDVEPNAPELSPCYADLRELPPVLIQVGSLDLLRSDGELMARRLRQAGVPCDLSVWHGQMHAFTLLAALLPEARAAVRELAYFAARPTGHG
ncbi:hypothetical protein GCM10027271_22350 [Saccharopolyspora gloriosae]|uniref:Acetyl esterase/lipase n=1 Tax=Saccharopolyspora gloriosae TaxID=455344 RepID=A0A840NH36_9PSEU|nr:acetyl esterase/lipase [Saccharopolyspora gloriosae]